LRAGATGAPARSAGYAAARTNPRPEQQGHSLKGVVIRTQYHGRRTSPVPAHWRHATLEDASAPRIIGR
jgi:hypothetical protein